MKLADLIIILILFSGNAAIAGTSSHEHAGHSVDPEMKKQHLTMSTIGKQWKLCKKALDDKNFQDAVIAVDAISKESAYISSFKLHKNKDSQKLFIEQCNAFKEKIIKLNDAIRAGDADAADSALNTVAESCSQCHKKFR